MGNELRHPELSKVLDSEIDSLSALLGDTDEGRVAVLLEACRAAIKHLNADIPSHPMRDKCFAAMGNARAILMDALEKAGEP